MVRIPLSIKLRTFHVLKEVRYRDPITRNGKSEGVRTDKTIAVQECAVVPMYTWVRGSKEINVMRRTITNSVIAPTEVRGLKCALLLQPIVE